MLRRIYNLDADINYETALVQVVFISGTARNCHKAENYPDV